MDGRKIQIPSLILPAGWASSSTVLATQLAAVELLDSLTERTSIEVLVQDLLSKRVTVLATEVVAAGVPGNLQVWVELSPYPSVLRPEQDEIFSTVYWTAIGGGGGPVAPLAPLVLVGTGVNGAQQTAQLAWTQHSTYCRVVVQTPVSANIATAQWAVQVLIEGQS